MCLQNGGSPNKCTQCTNLRTVWSPNGPMHLNVGNQSNITHELWVSIGCTYRCSPSTWCDGGGVVAQANRLVGPPKWACPGSGETHRQIQSALRPVDFALQSNPSVITNFENAGGMPPQAALGVSKVLGGVARPHTVPTFPQCSGVG
jgi:hypothetical protein